MSGSFAFDFSEFWIDPVIIIIREEFDLFFFSFPLDHKWFHIWDIQSLAAVIV